VLFDLSLFENEADRESSQQRVLWLLEALTRCDQLYLREHPDTPLIYQSGITYKAPEQFSEAASVPEVERIRGFLESANAPASVQRALSTVDYMTGGGEHFRDIPRVIDNGGGDCDNVASWRCAELREKGIRARPYITWRRRPDGGMTYHVVVWWPDGTHEDPSLLLGMGGEARADERREEERKLAERTRTFLSGLVRTRRLRTAIKGIVTPQNFSSLQYSIPFQTDDAYEDWSPTRPQGFYANPLYPNLPSTPGGMPMFNTRMNRRGEDFDYDFDPSDRFDRFNGFGSGARLRHRKRARR
jgi:hypothetical protein